jgi:hypothetical protein
MQLDIKIYILSDPNRRKQKIENNILYVVRVLQILNNTIRVN